MELPSFSFVAGLLFLIYLSSFILFALVRIFTGISIQRIGRSGLRRISFTPKDGLRIDIRGLGFSLHRPTFAQPTWISVVVTELNVTLDLEVYGSRKRKRHGWAHWRSNTHSSQKPAANGHVTSEIPVSPGGEEDEEEPRSRTWERLTDLKNRVKRLHRRIHWIRLLDVVAHSSSITVVDVGTLQVANCTIAVDTRRRKVDRSRLFQHKSVRSDTQRPAEWIITAKSVLFTPEGKDATEILDYGSLNVHGLLYKERDGLRDAAIALKLGRLSLPYDDLSHCAERVKERRRRSRRSTGASEMSFTDVMEELDRPGSREENIVQTVSDSKEFVSSILRGIREVQFAVGFFGMSQRIQSSKLSGLPVYMNTSMKEVGLDLLRLDQRSPAHLMYFSKDDVAHQALVTAISISVGIDDGEEHPERFLYIPMATATFKSTLPSKTIQLTGGKSSADRNTNILFGNLVVTSPSVDLDPNHLPLVLAILRQSQAPSTSSHRQGSRRHLFSRLLPKASIKISIHEPVIRVSLPPMEPDKKGTDEFDLLISVMSSMSLDVESLHSAEGELHYSLASNFRIASHQLYYQTASGEKHNLLLTDSAEVKTQLNASPEVAVFLTGKFQTFSVYLVRPEISEGVRQIVAQLRKGWSREQVSQPNASQTSFLRRLPTWLQAIQLQGMDFNFEVAGVDYDVSEDARGAALHLESWTAEYKAHRNEDSNAPVRVRRRAGSRSISREEYLRPKTPPSPRKKPAHPTDGRRLAIHVQGLEGFVIDSSDLSDQEPFLSLPRFEVAFSSSSDNEGPIYHVNSFARSLYLHYSLYRHYAIGVATVVLRKTFRHQSPASADTDGLPQGRTSLLPGIEVTQPGHASVDGSEITTVDFKAAFVQVKATMPADPPLMIQMCGFDAGRHRWTAPFARAQVLRLYAESPTAKSVWARISTLRSLRVDIRQSRRKSGSGVLTERSLDVAADAIRLAVPHQLVLHNIFDNLTNIVKTTQQLHHRFKTNSDEYILDKGPQGPKNVPKVSLRTHAFLFEIEDDAFEWKLGTIYRLGLLEQKQRLAREKAFQLKKKVIEDRNRRKSFQGPRARSTHHARSRSKQRQSEDSPRSKSVDSGDGDVSPRDTARGRAMRYDTTGQCGLSDAHHTPVRQAREKLQVLNAQSWKKRIDQGLRAQSQTASAIRSSFWGTDDMPEEADHKEVILAIPPRPPLMAISLNDLTIAIDKPSFPLEKYPSYLHRIGKGMPFDMQYSLLIPLNMQISTGEARVTLRDYPLPLLHVPAMSSGHSPRLPSLSVKTDFIIAEEFRGRESTRQAEVVVVPPEIQASGEGHTGLRINVSRTVAPVKTYSDLKVDINANQPTRITWGTSYQPAIQDMMQVVENFTKPAVDPSERVGFWDKIRLVFHSKCDVTWRGDGDVHLVLKGSRDPYLLTGHGAGFVMCWRDNVRWGIGQHNDARKIMTVDSGEYLLAIPDFSWYARQHFGSGEGNESYFSSQNYRREAVFQKTIMKLFGNVQWLAGLVFERNVEGGKRSFEFKPHYDVVLKNPLFAKAPRGVPYDAFGGFRSNHIHLSIAIAAPVSRDWSVTNLKPSSNYNSVHLTPRFFSHFFSWWSMFSAAMSIPIRQGPLWPGVEKSSKKFGRHLATIKYNLLLSPLYMSHMYKHTEHDESGQTSTSATGLKLRLNSFMLDLHQRREEFRTMIQGPNKQDRTTGMKINQVQLDFISADIRALSATIPGLNSGNLDDATEATLRTYQAEAGNVELSSFIIPDKDTAWIDMDDFVELDWILPTFASPEAKILPLAYAPRFTYFRQTDHGDSISGDRTRTSAFGNEPTHFCVMSARNDPRRVQVDLIQERLEQIKEQLAHNQRATGDEELKLVRGVGPQSTDKLEVLRKHSEVLHRKQGFLRSMMNSLLHRLEADPLRATPDTDMEDDMYFEAKEEYDPTDPEVAGEDAAPLADYMSDFNNRFIVHNAQLKWSNSLRNVILRYIHEVSQRRGFVYYMSRRAVKFILDIVDEQTKTKERQWSQSSRDHSVPTSPLEGQSDDDISVLDRIRQLVEDENKTVDANDPESNELARKPSGDDASEELAQDFTAQNTYHVRLIAPQIQLQSDKNPKAAVLVTAKGIQLKIVQIMDKDRVTDEVSGLVQRRFSATMDSLQIHVTNSKTFATEYLHMYSANRYGAPSGSFWPPWVPFEALFDFSTEPFGFSRVIHRTSASLRYDKYNTLRLKYNDDVTRADATHAQNPDSDDSRIDHLWVEFPNVRAICDSMQYYAMYIIVMDLLLYTEPLEKTRSERLEKIMLASDFSDLTGAPEMVIMLQERIRQLEEIKVQFQVNEKHLDRKGLKDRIDMEQDLAACEDELFFIMKAITTSQRKVDERAQTSSSSGFLKTNLSASEIVWHLIREKNESLAELQLKNALYDRTDNNDGSNENRMEIEHIHGLNLLPEAFYPEMVAPYIDSSRRAADGRDTKMFCVHWYMLEAIAGIPVLDHFEVNLFPLKLQLEREVAKLLFEYVFPGVGSNAFENGNFSISPLMVKHMVPPEDDSDETTTGQAQNRPLSEIPDEEYGNDRPGSAAHSVEWRLQPTLSLANIKRPRHVTEKPKSRHHWDHRKLFHSSGRSSHESIRMSHNTAELSDTLAVGARSPLPRTPSTVSNVNSGSDLDSAKRVNVHRSASKGRSKHSKEAADDLTQMMSRASNYMTLAYVKIPGVVLCLSYKGKGQRNFEDVHNLVFRMPTLEYRNKTWSNLDLALQLKKDGIRALISHTGAIIGNKFSHHRPNKQQQSRLREMANSSTVLNSTGTDTGSDSASAHEMSSTGGTPSDPRASFASGRTGSIPRNDSFSSSLYSGSGAMNRSELAASASPSIGPPSVQVSPEVDQGTFSTTLGQRLASISQGRSTRDMEESEESSARRKSKLLFGKKFLNSHPRS